MWAVLQEISTYAALGGLLVACAVGVVLVAFQLPGTWVILLLTAVAAWWWDFAKIGKWTILILLALAVLGELLEFFSAAMLAKRAGGSKRGAAGAIIGGIVGAIAGTFVIPVPILGTIAGACIGAGLGSIAGDRWAGRTWEQSMEAGRGAAIGRLWGTVAKVAVAILMWVAVAVAVFVP